MARCRSIKPGFMTNEQLPELGAHAHLLFACLWMVADREGRLEDRPKKIKGECMPHYKVDIEKLIDLLANGDDPFLFRYSVAGKRYIQIIKWRENQTPHHTEKASVIPAPPLDHGDLTVASLPSGPVHTTSNQLPVTNDQRPATSNQQPVPPRFRPPLVADVEAYCRERDNGVSAEDFVNFYASKGWKIGKNSMVDWKAAVRTWEKNADYSRAGPANDPRNVVSSLSVFLSKGKSNG